MLVKFNCNRRARWSGETATNMSVGSRQRLKHGYCNMSASLVKLLDITAWFQTCYTCWYGVSLTGPVPHNQTCVVVNMSVDPVAMMPGQLVGRK